MEKKHIFIVGAKSIGQYGGYETFVNKLTEYHKDCDQIKYHVACKANGSGCMDETKLEGVSNIQTDADGNVTDFEYNNAHAFKMKVPNIGPAVAIYYDVLSLNHAVKYCKENNIQNAVFYILACRIGPFMRSIKKKVKSVNGELYINPDGHEWLRDKWSSSVKRYWKYSEKQMVKHADLVVCDSKHIEEYIQDEYRNLHPRTTYISYGADNENDNMANAEKDFQEWLDKTGYAPNGYYLMVGRFVPENNYATVIEEFMKSKTDRKLVIITSENEKHHQEIKEKTGFNKDDRICFEDAIYNPGLLKKIRENAFGYIHGHEVGGTNPSLLEGMNSTKLNLLLGVGFNREVGGNAALYWYKNEGSLSGLIDQVETFDEKTIDDYGAKAKDRIRQHYTWQFIADEYMKLWRGEHV